MAKCLQQSTNDRHLVTTFSVGLQLCVQSIGRDTRVGRGLRMETRENSFTLNSTPELTCVIVDTLLKRPCSEVLSPVLCV